MSAGVNPDSRQGGTGRLWVPEGEGWPKGSAPGKPI